MLQRPPHSRRADRRARDQRYRRRRNAGKAVARVEYSAPVLDLLIATRWLFERDSADARAVGAVDHRAARRLGADLSVSRAVRERV